MGKELNILLVLHEGKLGGASKCAIELATELKNRGHSVLALVPFKKCQVIDELEKNNIEVISKSYFWWQYPSAEGKIKEILFRIVYRFNKILLGGIIKSLSGRKIDIVHSNSGVIDIGAYIAEKVGAKHIWHLREFADVDGGTKFIMNSRKSYKFIEKKSDRVLFVSKNLYMHYKDNIKKEKCKIIYDGLPKEYLYKKEQNEYFRNGEVNFLISGAVQEWKHQMDVIKACNILKNKGIQNFHVTIVGRKIGDYYLELEEKINEFGIGEIVSFLDFTNDMLQCRKNNDIELVCSKESFGRVSVEAMLASNMVIAANIGGSKEIVNDMYNGMLYKYEDCEQLAECMEKCINDKEMVKEMGNNAFYDSKEKFILDKCVLQLEYCYYKLLEK